MPVVCSCRWRTISSARWRPSERHSSKSIGGRFLLFRICFPALSFCPPDSWLCPEAFVPTDCSRMSRACTRVNRRGVLGSSTCALLLGTPGPLPTPRCPTLHTPRCCGTGSTTRLSTRSGARWRRCTSTSCSTTSRCSRSSRSAREIGARFVARSAPDSSRRVGEEARVRRLVNAHWDSRAPQLTHTHHAAKGTHANGRAREWRLGVMPARDDLREMMSRAHV